MFFIGYFFYYFERFLLSSVPNAVVKIILLEKILNIAEKKFIIKNIAIF